MKYRSEIDGLRAIAILAIVFFHIGFDFFEGGFVGVDVFFVISGYLITGLIVKEIQISGTFNFSRFYIKRASRLLPSLIVVLSSSLIFSYLLFTPTLLAKFGSSLISSLLGFSNIYFWRKAGYFDISSSLKPLLHTWALSVEVQFYLIWPIVVFFLLNKREKYKTSVLIIISIAVISFVLSEKFLHNNIPFIKLYFPQLSLWFLEGKSAVYYLTPFRMFEFMTGAIIVWLEDFRPENRLVNEILSVLGLIGIAYSICFFDNSLPFPSFYSLLPCFGTALIIFSRNAKLSYQILSIRALVFVGLISYTLYLVHWPIIVFFKFKKIYQITFWDQAIIALASLIISIIIYFFIEQPLRIGQFKKPHFSPKQFVVTGVSFALILLITGYYLRNGTIRGNNYLFDEGKVAYHASKLVNNEICNLKNYSLISEKTVSAACNDQARYQILTIGNSHEKHGYKLIKNLYLSEFKQDKLNIVFSSTDLGYGEFRGCSFSLLERLPLKSINPDCEWLANKLNDYQRIGSQFDAVIVSAFMPSLLGKIYMDYAYELQKVNPDLKIVVIGSLVSLSQYRCADLINSTKNPKACNDNRLRGYYNPNEEQEIKEKWPHLNFFYLDQRFLLCGNREYEQCEITVNDIPIFFDQHHFNDIAIPELISRIKEAKIDERLSTYLSL